MFSWELFIGLLRDLALIVSSILGVLAGGIRFTRRARKEHPRLNWLDGKQLPIFRAFLVCMFLAFAASIPHHILSPRAGFQLIDVPDFTGDKAVRSQFDRELALQMGASRRSASTYFNA